MAEMLNDAEISKLLSSVILAGEESCVRPNSYVLRLGGDGEFISTGKEFKLGDSSRKKGIKLAPGHVVGMTALETIDFRPETVGKIFPDCDLHGFLSPATDLAREGIVAPSTQIDAGYFGTLNWTLNNTSPTERRFLYGERLYRLTIFKLAKGERPDELYKGHYQSQTGYVRSQRKGAPVGMKESEWEDGFDKDGPEAILENLIKSGYPWNMLGQQFKTIDQQFKTVTSEYSDIHDSIEELNKQVASVKEKQGNVAEVVRAVLKDESKALRNDTLVTVATLMAMVIGLGVSIYASDKALPLIKEYGVALGVVLIAGAVIAMVYSNKNK